MRLNVILMFLVMISLSLAQSVKGTIVDRANKQALPGANVVVKGTFNGATTNSEGKFEVNNVNGNVTLVISYMGYKGKEVQAKSGDDVSIELAEEIYGETVVVTGSRKSESILESAISIEKMDAIAIKNAPAASFYEALSNLKSVDLVSASMGMKTINMRGFNSTTPDRVVQFVDGMDNQAPALNFPVSNLVGMSELDIESVEIIYGAASGLYGANAFNGVISMKSKNPWEFSGVSVRAAGGDRNFFNGLVRIAQNYNNAFAWKLNVSVMNAKEWESDNKYPSPAAPLFTEGDLTDPNTKNNKLSGGLYYRINESTELSYSLNYGAGTTVYQGAQRYDIKNFTMTQHKVQLDGKSGDNSWQVKAYKTIDDAGDTYNIGLLGAYMATDLSTTTGNPNLTAVFSTSDPKFQTKFDVLTSTPIGVKSVGLALAFGTKVVDVSTITHFEGNYTIADLEGFNIVSGASYRTYNPESAGSLFRDTGNPFNDEGDLKVSEYGVFTQIEGKLLDNTLKYTLSGRYDKNENFDGQFSKGASLVYSFKSDEERANNGNLRFTYRTAFKTPTLQDQYIGLNVGTAKSLNSALVPFISPRAFAVLYGNNNGFSASEVTNFGNTAKSQVAYDLTSVGTYFGAYSTYVGTLGHAAALGIAKSQLKEVAKVDAVKPEQVSMLEVGYKTIVGESWFIDLSAYQSDYTDLITDKNVIVMDAAYSSATAPDALLGFGPSNVATHGYELYIVDNNANFEVQTKGVSVSSTYNFDDNFAGNANWTFTELTKGAEYTGVGFNTPKHKVNLGLSGRKLGDFGFNVNFKHVDGYYWEGSGYKGDVNNYNLVDMALLYDINVSQQVLNLKLAVSNILDNKHSEAFGAPKIGRFALFQISADF